MKNDFLFDPESDTFLDDVTNHAKSIKSVKETLEFLESHAVTSGAWDLFSQAINQAYFKKLLFTSDDVKLLVDKINNLTTEINSLKGDV